jgi:hypothetical protein
MHSSGKDAADILTCFSLIVGGPALTTGLHFATFLISPGGGRAYPFESPIAYAFVMAAGMLGAATGAVGALHPQRRFLGLVGTSFNLLAVVITGVVWSTFDPL